MCLFMKWLFCSLVCLISLSSRAQIDSAQLMKDVEILSADKMQGRKAGSKGNRLAQFYLIERFREAGIQPFLKSFEHRFFFRNEGKQIMGTNLYGYMKGAVDTFIVISAHYDHIGMKPGADSIYNGADDNASGVAALLAIATYYKTHPPHYSLLFVAFDAEEMELSGAKAFALDMPVKTVLLNINMDMISHSHEKLYVSGAWHYPQLKPFVEKLNTDIQLLTGHDRPEDGKNDWTTQSDHFVFHQRGIPFLYFGVEDHSDYHTPSDEFTRINHDFFYRSAQTILQVIQSIDLKFRR